MNTKGLAKLYDHLTPHERLPLIIAASTRGDEVEQGRLANSAPRQRYEVPDCFPLLDALGKLSLLYLVELLDLAVLYWRISGHLEAYSEFFGDKAAEQPHRLEATLRMVAWRYCVEVDGWSRFCEGLKIEPHALLKDLPAYETLLEAEKVARRMAFTREEAEAHLRASGDDFRAPTADELGRRLRRDLDRLAAWWGGGDDEPPTSPGRASNVCPEAGAGPDLPGRKPGTTTRRRPKSSGSSSSSRR